MASHAGYAAAIAIRQAVLQDFLRVAYHAGHVPHWLTVPQSEVIGLSTNLFLDVPKLILHPANDDWFEIRIRGWGPISVAPLGGMPEERQVRVQIGCLVSPLLEIQTMKLLVRTGGATVVLSDLEIEPFSGGAFSPTVQAEIESTQFRQTVEYLIRVFLHKMDLLIPSLDVSFLGSVIGAQNATVSSRVLDGVLALGLDVHEGGVTTAGTPNLLTDFTGSNDISTWTNPTVIQSTLAASVKKEVHAAVENHDATLDTYSFTLEEGGFRIAGSASRTEGSVSFSTKAVPKLIRPGSIKEFDEEYGEHFVISTPAREELWFDMQEVDVDEDLEWWTVVFEGLVGVITLGIGIIVIESLIAMIRGNIVNAIESVSDASSAARIQEFTLPNTSEPTFRLRIEQFECHKDGVFMGMTLRAQFNAAAVSGSSWIAADEALLESATFRVKLPFDLLPDDPQLRVRWTVRRSDTNVIVLALDDVASEALILTISNETVPILSAPEFPIECRLYRAIGDKAQEFLKAPSTLRITDRLDRTHPFVRWEHNACTPVVRVESDGTHTILGSRFKRRRSDIHRTDVPGRCRMVRRFSQDQGRPELPPPVLEYLDELPFPPDSLLVHRAKVCDYCFFGGPTKTEPLI